METVSQEISQEEALKQREKAITGLVSKLEKSENTIYIYCPAMSSPSGGISVLFQHAKILKDAGKSVTIVYEPQQNNQASLEATKKARLKGAKEPVIIFDKFNPSWLGSLKEDIGMRCLAEGELTYSDGTTEKFDSVEDPVRGV